ncbi:malonate decarboxylase subunit epsilon [Psychrobacter aestuarii]|uniref:Malonate decarboxylase subunit epsilon n=1 Tax=Psychrobacter aestuarii TaxID=556327 RepID=A0ABP3FAI3_9GAMM|nr:malonate decarboxylase subunit epsilon [Psychrobacter aestuarii]
MNLIILFSGQGLQRQAYIDEMLGYMSSDAQAHLKSVVPDLFFEDAPLFDNQIAQPFIYTLQYYRWQHLQRLVGMPMAFAGYSLGEVSAFCCSAQLSYSDGLSLVAKRANLMQAAVTEAAGLLAVKGVPDSQLDTLLTKSQTHLSIKISRDQFIIAGKDAQLAHAADIAKNLGAQNVQRLSVSVPSHTPIMQTAATAFASYTETLSIPKMDTPIISASEGTKYSDNQQGLRILAQQIDHPLDWHLCLETIEEYQPSMVIEIGPGSALANMLAKVLPHVPCRSWDDFQNLDGLSAWIERNR